MKSYYKSNRGHHGRRTVRSIHHAERQQGRLFCRRWLRGIEGV